MDMMPLALPNIASAFNIISSANRPQMVLSIFLSASASASS
jgi:Na+(H+)/acetate symporter ActP